MLAHAFRDNPLNRAVIGEPAARRLRCNRLGMQLQLGQYLAHGEVVGAWRGPELVGVRMTVPPHHWPLPFSPFSARLRHALRVGFRVSGRWSQVGEVLEAHHPIGGHAYLAILGVRPHAQGQGVGRALLSAWLEEVDAAEAWAWLETDREACLPFYRAGGFELRESLEILGTPVHLMERPARDEAARAVG